MTVFPPPRKSLTPKPKTSVFVHPCSSESSGNRKRGLDDGGRAAAGGGGGRYNTKGAKVKRMDDSSGGGRRMKESDVYDLAGNDDEEVRRVVAISPIISKLVEEWKYQKEPVR